MNMGKAAHPSGSMGSSNPRRLRGERLHHHGDGVCHVVCAFWTVSDSWLVSCTRRMYILEVLQSEPPRLAPYQLSYKEQHKVAIRESFFFRYIPTLLG